jgi:4-hydroxymandelate oxidase
VVTLPSDPIELEAAARERLHEAAYNYYAAGAGAETGLEENVLAWRHWHIRPRVLVGVAQASTATTVLGMRVTMPVLTAPCAVNRLAHPDGELAVARAAAAVGTVQLLSTASSYPPEEVAACVDAPRWFQLYTAPDSDVTDQRIRRAEACGMSAIVLTVDLPALGIRYRGLGRFDELPDDERHIMGELFISSANPGLDWTEVERIHALTRLPLVLKGLLHPGDVRRAVDLGVEAIVVSNHGARQLDGTLPPALALPEAVKAAAGRLEVYVDGGVRSGADVLRALALGARAVLIGRPYLWVLALDGEAGVRELLERFRGEVANVMSLAGQRDAAAVDSDIVVASRLR